MKPELKLTGVDGNAFMLLGVARKVALANNMDWAKIEKEAMSGDYRHLLGTLGDYFDIT
jgi:hypothetical protein